jgi:hypothetical protein
MCFAVVECELEHLLAGHRPSILPYAGELIVAQRASRGLQPGVCSRRWSINASATIARARSTWPRARYAGHVGQHVAAKATIADAPADRQGPLVE